MGPKVIVSVDLDTDAPVSVEIKVTEKKEKMRHAWELQLVSSDNQPMSQGSKREDLGPEKLQACCSECEQR